MNIFNKIFKKKEALSLETPIDEIKKENKNAINIGQNLYPVIKTDNDRKLQLLKNTDPVVCVPIAEGIVLCFVLDMGNNFEMIQQSFLTKTGLTVEDLKQVAIRNLVNKLNVDCKIITEDLSEKIPNAKPFYRVQSNPNFTSAILLVDNFWETTAKEVVKSDIIAISIPAKNILCFSDMRIMESFWTMRGFADYMYKASEKDNIQLTKNTYIRKDGKWILFIGREKQFTDLGVKVYQPKEKEN